MNDRAVSVFEQYDLKIEQTRKVRGAIVAMTDIGPLALWEYAGKQVMDAYLNKRKSLPPRRQSEKLTALKKIEPQRMKFLYKLEKDLL